MHAVKLSKAAMLWLHHLRDSMNFVQAAAKADSPRSDGAAAGKNPDGSSSPKQVCHLSPSPVARACNSHAAHYR